MNAAPVLIVEDDPALREALSDTLELAGYPVTVACDGQGALERLEQLDIGMVVSDVNMGRMDGHALLARIRAQAPDLPVVLMTAYGTIEKAVEAMRDGATDYLVKPFEAGVLVDMVSRYLPGERRLESGLVAEDERSRQLAALATRVAATDATVMICGESGSGKEVFARFIHEHSPRNAKPFVAINCAAIPENMLEAVLFGYEKGAFTGAYRAQAGKFEQAQGGTLLLDEISEMDLALQAKLLRVLQEREVERLGGRELISLDVRVLATTNRNMREQVAAGRFREDLYYRLNVFPLNLPPLRARPADILPLAEGLLERYCRHGRGRPRLSAAAQQRLLEHHWPGNVRELDNVIQRALILLNGEIIEVADLCFGEAATPLVETSVVAVDNEHTREGLGDDLKSREYQLILEALEADRGSRKAAAERLGISPRTLRYKLARMREQGIAVPA
ncbi:MAG: sigma-54 dependent transcriptional regulator [Gammaproteobacteria bacterium]|nr:sigma-54 dependent transcriptional regulator [Gammaproteobacteria bacterium]